MNEKSQLKPYLPDRLQLACNEYGPTETARILDISYNSLMKYLSGEQPGYFKTKQKIERRLTRRGF